MVNFEEVIEDIRKNGGFESNQRDDSYYRTYINKETKPLQVRISSHGTHLWTWYERKYDPSYAINTCIVYSNDGTHNSKVQVDMRLTNEQGQVIGQRKPFEVIQYVYNCQLIDINDAALINQAVQSIWQNKTFKDPLAGTPKHAKVYKLIPNQPIQTLLESRQLKSNNKMRHIIILRESELKRVISETVKRTLKLLTN